MSCLDECCEIENGNDSKFAFAPYNDLSKAMPLAAKLLECDPSDLLVCEDISMYYMSKPSLRDRAIQAVGLSGIPFISSNNLHGNLPGKGLVLYEGRNNPALRYVVFCCSYGIGYTKYLHLVPRGSLFQLKRHITRQEQSDCEKTPPILTDGLLDSIVNDTVGFLMLKKDIEKYRIKIRRGILLSGDPGNGKTMICRWIQKLCVDNGISWGTVTGSEIESQFSQGKALDSLFNRWTVTFFDDIDISYLNRSRGNGKIACAILTAMDGVRQSDHIIRIFTTNETVSSLDEAFIRPGRIDRSFVLTKPDSYLRKKLILSWSSEIVEYLTSQNLLDKFVRDTEDLSFAEIDSVRTILVTNNLMKSQGWNLSQAMKDYYESRNIEPKSKPAGFFAA